MGVKDTANLAMIPAAYAEDKVYSVLPSDGDGDFTFTRSGSGTRINKGGYIETMGNNVPRLNYRLDADGNVSECAELLLEESRTNTHTYSESASGKTTSNVTLTNNQGISPMGTNTAIKVTEDTTFNRHRFYANSNSVTSGTTYTISCFVKKNSDNRYVFINADALLGVNGSFDLDTGSVTGDVQVFEVYPNGWYRIGITKTATSSTTNIYFVQMQQGTTDVSYTGDGSSFFFWGQQFEVGSNPSSYIPVPSTSNVQRNMDQAIRLSSDVTPTSYPFTVMVQMRIETGKKGFGFSLLNRFANFLYYSIAYCEASANNKFKFTNRGNGTIYSIEPDAEYFEGIHKVAVKFVSETNFKAYINGIEVANLTHTASAFDTNNSAILLGQLRTVTDTNTRNPIKEFFVWHKALTDAEMVDVTSYDTFAEMANDQQFTIQ